MSDSPKTPNTSDWQGILELEYRHHGGKTHISHQQSQAPLKLQRPFYPEGEGICHSVILHTAGGIVGGDRLHRILILTIHFVFGTAFGKFLFNLRFERPRPE